MKFRKFTAAVLAVLMGLSVLTACGNNETEEKTMDMGFVTDLEGYSAEVENVAMTIYVDCNVESSGDGSEESPYKTIPESQAKIAELKASETGLPVGGIRVLIASGSYDPFTLGPENSGNADCMIYYVAEEEHGVEIIPSTPINAADFVGLNDEEKARFEDQNLADKIVKVDLKNYGLTVDQWGKLYCKGVYNMGPFHEGTSGPEPADLYFNGNTMTLARYPNNEQWLLTGTLLDAGTNTKMPNFSELQDYGATFTIPDDLAERAAKWDTLEDVWTYGFFMYNWADASNPIKSIDVANKTLTLDHGTWYGIESNKMYYVFNVFEEMDVPGEFYIDRVNGILYMYPLSDMETARISIGLSYTNPISGGNAEYITVRGFFCGETHGNIVGLSNCNNITFENCEIKGSIGGGFWTSNMKNFTIQNCESAHTGHHAILVNNKEFIKDFENCNVRIYNNYIHHYLEKDGTAGGGIQIQSPYSVISHNEICDATFIAISWDGPYNVIEYNEIYNVCNTSSDAGAINTGRLFTSYGTEIRYNYIHDIGSDFVPGVVCVGVYWDDGMSGQTAYGNIIENVKGYGFLVGGGRDNQIYNNLMINCTRAVSYDNRVRDGEFGGPNEWFGKLASRGTTYTDIKDICSNDVWKTHFPHLSEIIIDPTLTDIDDPQGVWNPVGAKITNNILYRTEDDGGENWQLGEYLTTYGEVANNHVIYEDLSDFPAAENSGWYLKENSKLKELIPEFNYPDFDSMGRLK